MKKRDWIHLSVIVLLLVFGFYRYKQKVYRLNSSQILLDTQVEISMASKDKNLGKTMEKTFEYIKIMEKKFNYFDTESDLYKLNHNPSNTVLIDKDYKEIFKIAKKIHLDSDSLYDISIGQITDIWDFDKAVIPSEEQIKQAKNLSGFEKLHIKNNILEREPGIYINLGSISKGFIVDKAIEYMKKHNIEEGYVNAGGDIRVFSKKSNPIRIGIQHPRIANDIIATVEIDNKAIVTSGDYERFFEVDGVRYHHIINPKTGMPSVGTISVTVIADNATLADGLSTALFVMQPNDAINMLKKYPGVDAIIYYQSEDGIVSLKSEGMKKYLIKEKTINEN